MCYQILHLQLLFLQVNFFLMSKGDLDTFCWLLELKMSIDAFDILIDLEFDGKKAQGSFND